MEYKAFNLLCAVQPQHSAASSARFCRSSAQYQLRSTWVISAVRVIAIFVELVWHAATEVATSLLNIAQRSQQGKTWAFSAKRGPRKFPENINAVNFLIDGSGISCRSAYQLPDAKNSRFIFLSKWCPMKLISRVSHCKSFFAKKRTLRMPFNLYVDRL